MSTFFGGPQFLGHVRVTSNATGGVIYTAPAGRYAIVHVQSYTGTNSTLIFSNGGSLAIGATRNTNGIGFNVGQPGGAFIGGGGTASGSFGESIILLSGDTITPSGTASSVILVMAEYANP